MCCSQTVTRVFLVTVNSIFVVLGLCGLGLGLFYIGNQHYMFVHLRVLLGEVPSRAGFDPDTTLYGTSRNTTKTYTTVLATSLYTLTGTGAAVLVVAVFGLVGTIKESRAVLYAYSVLLVLIMAAESVAGIGFYLYRADIEDYVQTWLVTVVTDHYHGASLGRNNIIQMFSGSVDISEAVDFIQLKFQCCGITNYTNYYSAASWPRTYNFTTGASTITLSSVLVPVTCCKLENLASLENGADTLQFVDLKGCLTTGYSDSTNLNPCYTRLRDVLVEYSSVILGTSGGLLALQLFALLASCCLIRTKDDYINSEKLENSEC